MAPKREQSLSVKVSEYEAFALRRVAADADMEISELLRVCIALALPVVEKVDFSDRYNIQAKYSQDIVIEFGSESELSRKMKLVVEVIENQLEANFRGVLYAGTVGKVWADPENNIPDISIPDHFVYDEESGTYVDPAQLEPVRQPQSSQPEQDGEEEE